MTRSEKASPKISAPAAKKKLLPGNRAFWLLLHLTSTLLLSPLLPYLLSVAAAIPIALRGMVLVYMVILHLL